MNFFKQIYQKTEANPAKSTVGCLLAYAFLLLIGLAALYLAGATFRLFAG